MTHSKEAKIPPNPNESLKGEVQTWMHPTAIFAGSSRVASAVRELLATQQSMISFFRNTQDKEAFQAEVMYGSLDVTDISSVLLHVEQAKRGGAKCLINFAVQGQVDIAETERGNRLGATYKVNTLGPKNVAQACKQFDMPMIHLSTEYVFNGNQTSTRLQPNTPLPTSDTAALTWYGRTKALGELEVLEQYPEKSVIVRLGQIQSRKAGQFATTLQQLLTGKPFTRIADQTIAPICVLTAAEAILHIENALINRGSTGIFQVNATDELSSFDTALLLAEVFNLAEVASAQLTKTTIAAVISSGGMKVARPANTVMDTTRFENEIGHGTLGTIRDEIIKFKNLYCS